MASLLLDDVCATFSVAFAGKSILLAVPSGPSDILGQPGAFVLRSIPVLIIK